MTYENRAATKSSMHERFMIAAYPCQLRLVDPRETAHLTIPIPSWAPFRECVTEAWVDGAGRLHLDYSDD